MNDQTAKADAGKPRVSLVPSAIVYAIAKAREYGLGRYPEGGKDNWKRVEAERYRDALGRHYLAYIDDPYGVDSESGLPHLYHLATNVAFLCELDDEFIRKVARTIADEKEDGCCGCAFEDCSEDEYPCTSCQKNYMNMYERSE